LQRSAAYLTGPCALDASADAFAWTLHEPGLVKAGARPRQRVLDDHQRHKYNLTHSSVASPLHARWSAT
jgi:hypothetical protein